MIHEAFAPEAGSIWVRNKEKKSNAQICMFCRLLRRLLDPLIHQLVTVMGTAFSRRDSTNEYDREEIIRRRNEYTRRPDLRYNKIMLSTVPPDARVGPEDRVVMDMKIVPEFINSMGFEDTDVHPSRKRNALDIIERILAYDRRFNACRLLKRTLESHVVIHPPAGQNHAASAKRIIRSVADDMDVPKIMLSVQIGDILGVRRSTVTTDGDDSLIVSADLRIRAVPGEYQQRERVEPHTLLDLCLFVGACVSYGVQSSGFFLFGGSEEVVFRDERSNRVKKTFRTPETECSVYEICMCVVGQRSKERKQSARERGTTKRTRE